MTDSRQTVIYVLLITGEEDTAVEGVYSTRERAADAQAQLGGWLASWACVESYEIDARPATAMADL